MRRSFLIALAVGLPALCMSAPAAQATDRHVQSWLQSFPTNIGSAPATPRRLPPELVAKMRHPGRDDGEVMLDTTRFPALPNSWPNGASVASDGANCLVAWCPGNPQAIHAVRVSAQGRLLDSVPIAVADDSCFSSYPDVAFDGTNYLVVWQKFSWDTLGNMSQDVYGARVSPAGQVLDPDGIHIMMTDGNPTVAYGNGNYLVTWTDNATATIRGARVSTAGQVLDPDGIEIASDPMSWLGNIDVASNGTDYLVLWSWQDTITTAMYATRVSGAGVVLDPDGIPLAHDSVYHAPRCAAFDGANYLVISYTGSYPDVDLGGTRLAPSGVLLDSSPFLISDAPMDQMPGAITFDGANSLVTWVDGRRSDPLGRLDVYGARVTPAGTVLDPTGVLIDSLCDGPDLYAAASGTTNSLAIWVRVGNGVDFRAARITPAGQVLDPGGFGINFGVNQHYRPVVASGGSGFLAVWLDNRNEGRYDVFAARLDRAGQVLDEPSIAVARVSQPGYVPPPAVGFGGANYLAVWTSFTNDEGDLFGARITPAGQVLDTVPIEICTAAGTQMIPFVAFDGANYLVTWTDFRDNPGMPAVYGARVTPAGQVLDPDGFVIASISGGQGWPPAAFDGTNYLVAWIDSRNGEDDIYGARVTPAGQVLDPGGFPISRAASSQWYPHIDFDGTNYLVVWQDQRSGMFDGVWGTRVRPNGTVVDTGGLWFSGESNFSLMPHVRHDGTDYAVVWQDMDVNTFEQTVRGCHVSSAGAVVDTFRVEDTRYFDFTGWVSLAAGIERRVLVAWHDDVGEFQGRRYYTSRALAELGAFGLGIEGSHRAADPARLVTLPNPCRGRTTIRLSRSYCGTTGDLRIYSPDGRLVRTLRLPARTPLVLTWDGTDDAGRALPAGVYVASLSVDGVTTTAKLVIQE